MAVNWARTAWTIAFLVLGLMALVIYTEYAERFKQKFGDVKTAAQREAGVKRTEKAERPKGPPPRLPRRSRKYRRRR